MKHLGLIVEDRSDADVVQELARKIARRDFAVRAVLAGGCGKMQGKARAWAQDLRRNGCSLLVLIRDLDNRQLDELVTNLRAALDPCPIADHVIVIAVREIEAWLLADHDAVTIGLKLRRPLKKQSNPEAIENPKERLRDLIRERSRGSKIYLNTVDNVRIARSAHVANLRRCASFLPFERFIRRHL